MAIAGIAKHVGQIVQDEYLIGLWREEIHIGLLWISTGVPLKESMRGLPSWSWANSNRRFEWLHSRQGQSQSMISRVEVQRVVPAPDPFVLTAGMSLKMKVTLFRTKVAGYIIEESLGDDVTRSFQGRFEGKIEGTVEGVIDGKAEGVIERKVDGEVGKKIDGKFRGIMDGKVQGKIEGKVYGSINGKVKGKMKRVVWQWNVTLGVGRAVKAPATVSFDEEMDEGEVEVTCMFATLSNGKSGASQIEGILVERQPGAGNENTYKRVGYFFAAGRTPPLIPKQWERLRKEDLTNDVEIVLV